MTHLTGKNPCHLHFLYAKQWSIMILIYQKHFWRFFWNSNLSTYIPHEIVKTKNRVINEFCVENFLSRNITESNCFYSGKFPVCTGFPSLLPRTGEISQNRSNHFQFIPRKFSTQNSASVMEDLKIVIIRFSFFTNLRGRYMRFNKKISRWTRTKYNSLACRSNIHLPIKVLRHVRENPRKKTKLKVVLV